MSDDEDSDYYDSDDAGSGSEEISDSSGEESAASGRRGKQIYDDDDEEEYYSDEGGGSRESDDDDGVDYGSSEGEEDSRRSYEDDDEPSRGDDDDSQSFDEEDYEDERRSKGEASDDDDDAISDSDEEQSQKSGRSDRSEEAYDDDAISDSDNDEDEENPSRKGDISDEDNDNAISDSDEEISRKGGDGSDEEDYNDDAVSNSDEEKSQKGEVSDSDGAISNSDEEDEPSVKSQEDSSIGRSDDEEEEPDEEDDNNDAVSNSDEEKSQKGEVSDSDGAISNSDEEDEPSVKSQEDSSRSRSEDEEEEPPRKAEVSDEEDDRISDSDDEEQEASQTSQEDISKGRSDDDDDESEKDASKGGSSAAGDEVVSSDSGKEDVGSPASGSDEEDIGTSTKLDNTPQLEEGEKPQQQEQQQSEDQAASPTKSEASDIISDETEEPHKESKDAESGEKDQASKGSKDIVRESNNKGDDMNSAEEEKEQGRNEFSEASASDRGEQKTSDSNDDEQSAKKLKEDDDVSRGSGKPSSSDTKPAMKGNASDEAGSTASAFSKVSSDDDNNGKEGEVGEQDGLSQKEDKQSTGSQGSGSKKESVGSDEMSVGTEMVDTSDKKMSIRTHARELLKKVDKASKEKEAGESAEEGSEDETESEEESTAKKKKKAKPKKSIKKEEESSEEESSEYETDDESSEEKEDTTSKKKPKGKGKGSKAAAKKKKSKSKSKGDEESSEEESSEYETDDESEDEKSTSKKKPKDKNKGKKSKKGDDNSFESISEEDLSSSEEEEDDSADKHKAIWRSGEVTEFYDLKELIEKGSVANIHAAKSKETGALRAARHLRESEDNESNKKLILNEFELLKDLDHPNLIKIYELFENDGKYCLVTDVCRGGTLKDELMKSGLYSEMRAARLMKQLLTCVKYIHGNNIVHRDLKPSSILLEGKDKDQIRVIEFGMATRCKKKDRLSEPVGTPAYMAPEILGMSYGKASDMWSCGVLLFLILSGQQPFKGSTTEETFTNIVTGAYSFADPMWKKISDDAKDMITKLLTWDESARPTAGLALKHPWIVNNASSKLKKQEASSAEGETKESEESDAHSKLRLAACKFLASQLLTESEKTRIEEVFESLAKDSKVTREKVKMGFQSLLGKHLGDDKLEQIFQQVAAKSAKALEYSEFVFGALWTKELLSKDNLTKIFEIFGKGYVTVHELRDLLKLDLSLEKKAVKTIIAEVDKGGESKILYDDFLMLAGVPNPERKPTSGSASGGSSPASSSKGPQHKRLDKFLQEDMSDPDGEGEDVDNKSMGSVSVKVSATHFVSHRLGQLTEHYEIVDFIAKGTYGVVCSALHKETGTVRAVKELKKSKKNKEKNELMLKEFHILKTLDHPNILKMHELFEDKRHYYIVTGVSEGGDLFKEIKRRGRFEESEAAVLMKQILICVNYCHRNNIVHRDLKPGNILLEEHKKLDHIKIIDFGEAVVSEPAARLTEVTGTMAYMAPEVLGMSYGHKCDIWSCGIIAYLVLSGKQAVRGQSDEETFKNIVKNNVRYDDPIWEKVSDNALDFVKQLLSWDEGSRPTAEEALEHRWIVKIARRKSTDELRRSTMEALSNIEAFAAQSKLRVATCAFIASQLMDKEQKEKIDDVFRAIDLNHDGSLNREEVKQGYEKYFDREISDQEIDAIFKQVDADKTGELEYSEFLFGALDKENLLSEQNLKKAFSIFDKTGDGFITTEELKSLLQVKDGKALKKYMAQVDADGDGKISYEDFANMALGTEDGSPAKQTSKKKGILKDESKYGEGTSDKSVTFSVSDLGESSEEDSMENKGPPLNEVKADDGSSRHLQKAIARASKQQKTSRSNRDPPIYYNSGRSDPPTMEERVAALRNQRLRRADPPQRYGPKSQQYVSPLSTPDVAPGKDPKAARSVRRLSPRDAKIDEACQGFDKVQEKIARLRTLLTAEESSAKSKLPTPTRRSRDRKRLSNLETLDSAFAKLNQIQSKMRTLQALVKANKQ